MLDKSPSYGVAKDPKFIAHNDTHVRSNLVIVGCLFSSPWKQTDLGNEVVFLEEVHVNLLTTV